MIHAILYSQYFYISILLFSLCGICLADWQYKLAFWYDWRSSAKSIGFVIALLLLFDIAGIQQQIFSTNQSYVVGIYIMTPNLPIEELLFLFLLCYVTLILYRLFCMRQAHA